MSTIGHDNYHQLCIGQSLAKPEDLSTAVKQEVADNTHQKDQYVGVRKPLVQEQELLVRAFGKIGFPFSPDAPPREYTQQLRAHCKGMVDPKGYGVRLNGDRSEVVSYDEYYENPENPDNHCYATVESRSRGEATLIARAVPDSYGALRFLETTAEFGHLKGAKWSKESRRIFDRLLARRSKANHPERYPTQVLLSNLYRPVRANPCNYEAGWGRAILYLGAVLFGAELSTQSACTKSSGGSEPGASIPDTKTDKRLWLQVSAGGSHTCGLRTNRSVECWGSDIYNKTSPPPGAFTQISAGKEHTCGVKTDKSVECWGAGITSSDCDILSSSFECGQSSPPPGSFTKVSAGSRHSCGVKTDESVECWGKDEYDYYHRGWLISGEFTRPSGTFTQVSMGYDHACAIRTDKSVACWGSTYRGQSRPPPEDFIQVSAGKSHTCGVKTDGSVECRGQNNYGQTDVPE